MTKQMVTQTVRLKPTIAQERYFWRATRVDNAVYNKAKEWDDNLKESTGDFATQRYLLDSLKELKSWNEYFQGIEYHTLREGVFRYLDARDKAFKKIRKWTRFHSLKHSRKRSFHVREDGLRFWSDRRVIIPGMSKIDRRGVKFSEVNVYDLSLKPKKARVVFDGKYWMLKYAVEVDLVPEEFYTAPVGVDLGLISFAVSSEGKRYSRINDNLKYRKLKERIKGLQRKLQRQRDAKIKGEPVSRNYLKTKFELRAVERHMEELKKTYQQTVARDILRNNPCVLVLEDLNISGMLKNKRLSSHIHEVGWYAFRSELEWQQRKRLGKTLIADTFFPSSKMCSSCGGVKESLSLGERKFVCVCGFSADRDVNAAVNLRNLAGSVSPLNSFGGEATCVA